MRLLTLLSTRDKLVIEVVRLSAVVMYLNDDESKPFKIKLSRRERQLESVSKAIPSATYLPGKGCPIHWQTSPFYKGESINHMYNIFKQSQEN